MISPAIKDAIEIFGILVATVTPIFLGVRMYIYTPIKNIVAKANYIVEAIENNESVLSKHSEILKELQPNHGSSLTDKVDRMGLHLKNLNDNFFYIKNLSTAQLDLVDFPVWKSNKLGENTFVNESYKDLFEVDLDNVLDYKWASLIHKDDIDEYIKDWKASLEYKTDKTSVIRIVTAKTRKIIKCKITWKVMLDESGKDIAFIIGRIYKLDKNDQF